MPQSDYQLDASLNIDAYVDKELEIQAALRSWNSGPDFPANPLPYDKYIRTPSGDFFIRSGDNTKWNPTGNVNQPNLGIEGADFNKVVPAIEANTLGVSNLLDGAVGIKRSGMQPTWDAVTDASVAGWAGSFDPLIAPDRHTNWNTRTTGYERGNRYLFTIRIPIGDSPSRYRLHFTESGDGTTVLTRRLDAVEWLSQVTSTSYDYYTFKFPLDRSTGVVQLETTNRDKIEDTNWLGGLGSFAVNQIYAPEVYGAYLDARVQVASPVSKRTFPDQGAIEIGLDGFNTRFWLDKVFPDRTDADRGKVIVLSETDRHDLDLEEAPDGRIAGLSAVFSDDTLTGNGLTTSLLSVANPFTETDEAKLDGIEAGAEVNVQADWTEDDPSEDSHILNKPDVLLEVESDGTLEGKGTSAEPLSVANAFTPADKTRLDAIKDQQQVDWDQTEETAVDFIKNKPDTITTAERTKLAGLQEGTQSDWDAVSGAAAILNKPDLADVATSGDFADLDGKPLGVGRAYWAFNNGRCSLISHFRSDYIEKLFGDFSFGGSSLTRADKRILVTGLIPDLRKLEDLASVTFKGQVVRGNGPLEVGELINDSVKVNRTQVVDGYFQLFATLDHASLRAITANTNPGEFVISYTPDGETDAKEWSFSVPWMSAAEVRSVRLEPFIGQDEIIGGVDTTPRELLLPGVLGRAGEALIVNSSGTDRRWRKLDFPFLANQMLSRDLQDSDRGKVLAVDDENKNQLVFREDKGGGSSGGLATVESDTTLTGDGSSDDPLKVAKPVNKTNVYDQTKAIVKAATPLIATTSDGAESVTVGVNSAALQTSVIRSANQDRNLSAADRGKILAVSDSDQTKLALINAPTQSGSSFTPSKSNLYGSVSDIFRPDYTATNQSRSKIQLYRNDSRSELYLAIPDFVSIGNTYSVNGRRAYDWETVIPDGNFNPSARYTAQIWRRNTETRGNLEQLVNVTLTGRSFHGKSYSASGLAENPNPRAGQRAVSGTYRTEFDIQNDATTGAPYLRFRIRFTQTSSSSPDSRINSAINGQITHRLSLSGDGGITLVTSDSSLTGLGTPDDPLSAVNQVDKASVYAQTKTIVKAATPLIVTNSDGAQSQTVGVNSAALQTSVIRSAAQDANLTAADRGKLLAVSSTDQTKLALVSAPQGGGTVELGPLERRATALEGRATALEGQAKHLEELTNDVDLIGANVEYEDAPSSEAQFVTFEPNTAFGQKLLALARGGKADAADITFLGTIAGSFMSTATVVNAAVVLRLKPELNVIMYGIKADDIEASIHDAHQYRQIGSDDQFSYYSLGALGGKLTARKRVLEYTTAWHGQLGGPARDRIDRNAEMLLDMKLVRDSDARTTATAAQAGFAEFGDNSPFHTKTIKQLQAGLSASEISALTSNSVSWLQDEILDDQSTAIVRVDTRKVLSNRVLFWSRYTGLLRLDFTNQIYNKSPYLYYKVHTNRTGQAQATRIELQTTNDYTVYNGLLGTRAIGSIELAGKLPDGQLFFAFNTGAVQPVTVFRADYVDSLLGTLSAGTTKRTDLRLMVRGNAEDFTSASQFKRIDVAGQPFRTGALTLTDGEFINGSVDVDGTSQKSGLFNLYVPLSNTEWNTLTDNPSDRLDVALTYTVDGTDKTWRIRVPRLTTAEQTASPIVPYIPASLIKGLPTGSGGVADGEVTSNKLADKAVTLDKLADAVAARLLPASLGTKGQVLQVNSGATGVEYATPSASGGGGGMANLIEKFVIPLTLANYVSSTRGDRIRMEFFLDNAKYMDDDLVFAKAFLTGTITTDMGSVYYPVRVRTQNASNTERISMGFSWASIKANINRIDTDIYHNGWRNLTNDGLNIAGERGYAGPSFSATFIDGKVKITFTTLKIDASQGNGTVNAVNSSAVIQIYKTNTTVI